MEDKKKTKAQLIEELQAARSRLEKAEGTGKSSRVLSGERRYLTLTAAAERELPAGEIGPLSGRVLIMDDEPIVVRVLSTMLKTLGCEVEAVPDGTGVLDAWRWAGMSGAPYDVVVMDLTIPGGMGGKEAVVKLLELDPEAKAIVSSGYCNDSIMSNFGEYGFRGALRKPYQVEEVCDVLSGIMLSPSV